MTARSGGDQAFSVLMAQAAGGDARAREAIVRRALPLVRERVHRELTLDFRRRHRWLLPILSTGDIVQDVLIAVLQELRRVDIENEATLARYLATLVRHRLLKVVRRFEAQRRDQRRMAAADMTALVDPAPRGPEPVLTAALAEQVRIMQEVLATFPEPTRVLLELRLSQDETFTAIAAQLGFASAETARQAYVKAHARLLVRLRARGLRADSGETR